MFIQLNAQTRQFLCKKVQVPASRKKEDLHCCILFSVLEFTRFDDMESEPSKSIQGWV